jgi:fatty-acyl-CoA synthase/long-chain acyl-CoA synthetase
MLLRTRAERPDAEALVFPEARLSYAELAERALGRARALWAAGVRPRDHVGLLLPTSAAFVETLFAVALCGAVSVLLNARYRAAELAYVAENADLVAIVTTDKVEIPKFLATLREAFPDLAAQPDPRQLTLAAAPRLKQIIAEGVATGEGLVGLEALIAEGAQADEAPLQRARLATRLRDTCMILYTSGTSANPKGCLLSHEAVVRETMMLGRHRWRYTPQDRVWSPLPLYHVAAMCGMLAMIDVGGTFIGMPHFDPHESLKMIEREQATSLFVPFVTFLQDMMLDPYFEQVDLSRVKHMNSCFAAQPAKVGQTWRRKAPHILQCGTYGMTEAAGIVTTGGWDMDPELGFTRLGWPLPGLEVRVIDIATGEEAAVDAQGEIQLRGYSLLDGYYKDPERTAAAFDAKGWFRTGDIGSWDANGHLMFHGRFKDMLKVGGENVAAAEVEAVLAAHPAVELAQIVGLPDERLVEIPAAFVKCNAGASASAEELIAFVRARLASFKTPRHIRFVEDWPMSASKIQKFKLRQSLMAELGLTD